MGATILSNAIKKISPLLTTRPEIMLGVDSPDDCAVVRIPSLSPSPAEHVDAVTSFRTPANVHTVDFFRSFYEDPFVFGKVAACHALSDCHAMGVW